MKNCGPDEGRKLSELFNPPDSQDILIRNNLSINAQNILDDIVAHKENAAEFLALCDNVLNFRQLVNIDEREKNILRNIIVEKVQLFISKIEIDNDPKEIDEEPKKLKKKAYDVLLTAAPHTTDKNLVQLLRLSFGDADQKLVFSVLEKISAQGARAVLALDTACQICANLYGAAKSLAKDDKKLSNKFLKEAQEITNIIRNYFAKLPYESLTHEVINLAHKISQIESERVNSTKAIKDCTKAKEWLQKPRLRRHETWPELTPQQQAWVQELLRREVLKWAKRTRNDYYVGDRLRALKNLSPAAQDMGLDVMNEKHDLSSPIWHDRYARGTFYTAKGDGLQIKQNDADKMETDIYKIRRMLGGELSEPLHNHMEALELLQSSEHLFEYYWPKLSVTEKIQALGLWTELRREYLSLDPKEQKEASKYLPQLVKNWGKLQTHV